jgi:hypothetical protein
MVHRDQRKREAAGLDSGQVHGGEAEAHRGDGRAHRPAQRVCDGADEIVGGQLDAGDVAVVAYPQLGEAQPV